MPSSTSPASPSSGPGASTPCTSPSVSCPHPTVHAQLRVKEITFSDNHTVERDTLGNFPSPEWQSAVAVADNSPLCYTRDTKIKMTVKFSVTQQPSASESVQIKGEASVGSSTMRWTKNITVGPSDTEVSASGMISNVNLPNEVNCYDPLTIAWSANPASTGWSSAGSSSHIVYVVLADPSGTPVYWTLVDISCRAAAGKVTEDDVVTSTYGPFQSRTLTRKRDSQGLTYWNPNTTTCTNTSQLLARADGSGQCGSWAHFLIDMYKCHGITSADKVLIVKNLPMGIKGFLVKNWNFIGAGSHTPPWTHSLGAECVELPGVPGQRNPNPPPAFLNHFIVIHGGKFYDPSYGSTLFADQITWENASIDGLYKGGAPALAGYKKSTHSTTKLLEFYNIRTGTRI